MQEPEATTEATQAAFAKLAQSLASHGATQGKMFGMTCLKGPNGKAFVGLFGDRLVFKLTDPEHSAAMKLPGAMLFDPSGSGRPMKEWVVLARAHASHWTPLATKALGLLTATTSKTKPTTASKIQKPVKATKALSVKR